MPRKPIIGVIGGNQVQHDIVSAAEAVGRAVAMEGAVLLTGGQPTEGNDVKRAAMRGAFAAQGVGAATARLIGVLPSAESAPRLGIDAATQRFIETDLSSFQRNPINVLTSDAIIVMVGGGGTLAELGFALVACKPVFFAGSFGALTNTIVAEREKMRQALIKGIPKYVEFCGRPLTYELVQARLERLFAPDNRISGTDCDVEKAARELVQKAIDGLGDAYRFLESGFPGLPSVLTKQDLEVWLSEMP
ncbi:hypothetical protein [Allomesorhizobium camelthorni]|uniref:TIGR00725 family protein n=1 Tax=Allomesorhizobium camelthorni TaxID=475069 RepID=A0A6G4WK32_9HYPH|nr:hypothetical protein [Mesorhizobium camelthorni]NGO54718.1 hypothetical protein [Mesorhizobium camelthorni]